jgi:hypothetical protein
MASAKTPVEAIPNRTATGELADDLDAHAGECVEVQRRPVRRRRCL